MSKRINVNPDHYKVAGRERQGEDIVATEHKQKFVNVHRELATRAEQRNASLESMRAEKAQAAREASPGRTAQARGRKKTVTAPRKSTENEEGEGGAAPRRRLAVPAGVRRIAAAGSSAASGAKNLAAKAKKAVTRRPKQALPKKRASRKK